MRCPRPPFFRLTRLLAPLLVLAACTQFPQVDAFPPAAQTAPPALLPLDSLLTQAQGPAVAEGAGEALAGRAARLKSRARLMRGPVHDPETRARLAAAIAAGRA